MLTESAGIRTRGIESITSANVAVNASPTPRDQRPASQVSEGQMKQAVSSKGARQVANKGTSQLHHISATAANMQSPNEKNIKKMGQEVELVWVQTVEAEGFWVTFSKSNIGKTNKVSNPPSGWCRSDGKTAPPAEGDKIKVVFEPGLDFKDGFCLVRQVGDERG